MVISTWRRALNASTTLKTSRAGVDMQIYEVLSWFQAKKTFRESCFDSLPLGWTSFEQISKCKKTQAFQVMQGMPSGYQIGDLPASLALLKRLAFDLTGGQWRFHS